MKSILLIKLTVLLFIMVMGGCIVSLESDINLGDGYHLFGTGVNTFISKEVPGKKGVYDDLIIGRIVSQMHDNKYIVVYREVDKKDKDYLGEHHLWTEVNNTPINQFWVINKDDGTIYGPLDFIEYIDLKKEKGIKLRLEV